jgi:hypothetical protein
METIYRIQDKDGREPYKPGFSHLWVEEREDMDFLKSTITEFGLFNNKVLYGESCGCGCRSLEQLRRWFTKREYKKLKKYGYDAVKMEVNRIIDESETQLVFGRAKSLTEDFKKIKLY